jgi:hypothetical protein
MPETWEPNLIAVDKGGGKGMGEVVWRQGLKRGGSNQGRAVLVCKWVSVSSPSEEERLFCNGTWTQAFCCHTYLQTVGAVL